MMKEASRSRVLLHLIVFLCAFAVALPVRAASEEGSDSQDTEKAAEGQEGKPKTEEELTITGERSVVEQGQKSLFVDLPPRDLLKRPLTESPGLETSTSVVGRNEIALRNDFSLVDALRFTPGAWTESRGRKVKEFISVRGQAYPYPKYLIDGAWFREFHETNFFMSAANVERLEILRSNASMLKSPGGMVGLINIVPRQYTERETQLTMYRASQGTWRTQVNHGNRLEDLEYAVGGGFYHTDGETNMNAEENMGNLFGRVVKQINPDLELSLMAMYMDGDRELEMAEPPAHPRFLTRKDSFDPMRFYFGVAKAHYEPTDRASTEVILNYGKRRFDGHRVGSPDWTEEDYEWGARLVQSLKLTDTNTLRVSGMYNHWRTPTGKRFYVGNPGELQTFAGVISDEQKINRLTLNGAFRVSRTYVDQFGGFNVEGSPRGGLRSVEVQNEWEDPLLTGSAGAAYQLTDEWSLHGNASMGEISARPGIIDVNLQRPDDETRLKYDLGIKREWEEYGEVSLTGFYVEQEDTPLLTRNVVQVNGEPYILFDNGNRENYGVELDTRTKRFENGLQFFANAVAMQTRREMNDDWADDEEVPQVVLGGGASYLWLPFEVSVMGKHVSEYENQRFTADGIPRDLGSFETLDLIFNYYFGSEYQHKAFFGIENLNDQEYSTVVGWPDEGRRLEAGLTLTF